MFQKNKKQMIISSVIILLPMVIGLLLWEQLPEQIATHWGTSSEPNGFSSKAFAVCGLPVLMLVFHWVCILVSSFDPNAKKQGEKVKGMLLWIFPMISLLMNGMVYCFALGYDLGVDVVVRFLVGLMFLMLGNYMPKCTQNYTIGIKVTWTLRNEENWNKTHRFAGKVWVLGGVLILLTLFIPLESFAYISLAAMLALIFSPVVYSYLYYRKQLKAGMVTKENGKMTPMEKKSTIIAMVIVVVSLILVAITMFTGEITVEFGDSDFRIETGYWEDATVTYAEIDSVEYRETDDAGSRTYGFGSAKLLMGNFENTEFGAYTRYSYTTCDSCIVLTVDDKVLVLNGENEKGTKEIYEELLQRISEISE